MLQSFRNNLKGVGASIIVGIIVIPFVFFGVDSLFLSGGNTGQVAEVNGEPISEFQLLQATEMYKRQLMDQFQGIDPSLLSDEMLESTVLESLIGKRVIEQAARDGSMAVPVEEVYSLLVEVPGYQLDGQFSTDRYEYAIRQMGYTPTTHARVVAGEILQQVFMQGPALSGFATEQEIQAYAALIGQERDYYYLTIPAASVAELVEVNDEDINSYYQGNPEQFKKPEQVRVEFVELQVADLLGSIDVSDEDISSLYQTKLQALSSSSQRKVAHILIETGSENAEARLTEVQEKLNANDFTELAKAYSDDLGTNETGGDLGYVAVGDLPESLDAAVFATPVGEVSGPVESEAGTHFLLVSDERQAEVPKLESMKIELRNELATEKASELFVEQVEQMREEAYNASSLAETASLVGVELQQSELFSRQGNGHPVTGNPQVVNVAFSQEVLVDGYPSEVLELSDEHAVVLRVVEHQEESIAPLNDVREEISLLVKNKKSGGLLQQRADQVMEQVSAGESLESVAQAEGFDWQVGLSVTRDNREVNAEVRDFVFGLPAADSVLIKSLRTAGGDLVVVSQKAVRQGELSAVKAENVEQMRLQLSAISAARETANYQRLLIEQSDIEK